MYKSFLQLYTKFASVPSLSGQEEHVRKLIVSFLTKQTIPYTIDQYGNVKAFLAGSGKPIFLNAHMDRVKPGLAHTPFIEGEFIYSDRKTNSGADDILGIITILSLLDSFNKQKINHKPLYAYFTIEEEIGGTHGSQIVSLDELHTDEGVVVDNAFDQAGTVVAKGAAIAGFNLEIQGKSIHSGKDLSQGINALQLFMDAHIAMGSYHHDETRVNIGYLTTGTEGTRNAVPGILTAIGEIRSFYPPTEFDIFIDNLFKKLIHGVEKAGGKASVDIEHHHTSYTIDVYEPLVQEYVIALKEKNRPFVTQSTFVGSDCNAFRARGLKTFVISTGARNEHTKEEYFNIQDSLELVDCLIIMIQNSSTE